MTSNCTEIEPRLESLLSGETSDGDFKRLLEHAAGCRSCRSLILLHFHLASPEMERPALEEDEAMWMRRGVVAAAGRTGSQQEATGWIGAPGRAQSPVARLAAAVAIAVLGLTAGWALFSGNPPGLLEELSAEAAGNRRLVDSTESPYLISNVSLREVNGNHVTVDFDVTTHLEVTRLRTDPLVREVLVQALLSQANPGQSLRAIRFSEELRDSRVKEALLFAARYDATTGVRLRALQAATRLDDDPDVLQACTQILQSDDSVQMRLLAVDYLARASGGSRILEAFVESEASDASVPVRLRAASYLQ